MKQNLNKNLLKYNDIFVIALLVSKLKQVFA